MFFYSRYRCQFIIPLLITGYFKLFKNEYIGTKEYSDRKYTALQFTSILVGKPLLLSYRVRRAWSPYGHFVGLRQVDPTEAPPSD